MFKGYPQQYAFSAAKGEGSYRVSVPSGLLTGVAAKTATAGHLFAARFSPAPGLRARVCVIRRAAVTLRTITGFTAEQEVGVSLFVLRGYTASHAGGTAVDLGGTVAGSAKKRTTFPLANAGFVDMRVGSTGALTAGTHVLDPLPVDQDSYVDLATGAAVQHNRAATILLSDQEVDPIVLAPDEGILVTNNVLMGAGGTARLVVTLDWLVLERF